MIAILMSAVMAAAPGAVTPDAAPDPEQLAALLRQGGRDLGERRDTSGWSGGAAAGGLATLVLADIGTVFAAGLLLNATKPHDRRCEVLCVDPTAAVVALAGFAVIPPTVATLVADGAHGEHDGTRAVLVAAAQGSAIALFLAGASSGDTGTQKALLLGAAALHFVGVPLALGFAPVREGPGGGLRDAPVLSLAAKW